jgi:hypothetical protein
MVVIKIDGEWRVEDLGAFVEPVEIYDANEKFLGLFVPANLERGKELYVQAIAKFAAKETSPRPADGKPPRLHSEVIAELTAKYAPHQ